ncbi:MAG: ABC transporter substrate-binding protein [Methylococcales bacterium]|nr:ABC transporter substrate-binding protein [Methylococcales bacterium]
MKRVTVHCLVMVLLLPWFINAQAQSEVDEAQQVIARTSEKVKQTLSQAEYQQDFVKATGYIDGIISELVDMRRVTILVLGKNVRSASPKERSQFMQAFKTLLVRTYTKAFVEYKNWTLTFEPNTDTDNDGKTLVKTQVHQPGQSPVKVHYRMIKDKQSQQWLVYDILIEGVSLVTNYRATFNQEIAKTGSLHSVIDSLAEKNRAALGN